MYNFIVGGYLPGTNIQISLTAWLAIYTVALGSAAIIWLEHKQHLSGGIQFKRNTLFASQLHIRFH